MLLSNRKAMDADLSDTISSKTADWRIEVKSIESRDVLILVALQDATSRQARASGGGHFQGGGGRDRCQIHRGGVDLRRQPSDPPPARHEQPMRASGAGARSSAEQRHRQHELGESGRDFTRWRERNAVEQTAPETETPTGPSVPPTD